MRPIPFANALAAATGLFAVALFLLRLVAPRVFAFVFNSQFFGADVASLFPPRTGWRSLFGAFIVIVITAWVFGLLWAVLYYLCVRGGG